MERDQLRALVRATGCAVEREGVFFLGDAAAREAGAQLKLRPSSVERRTLNDGARGDDGLGWLCIATGGTSGGVRFARHDERTLAAAVQGFCRHFGVERVNAVSVLPAYHVSGLMARVRCALTGGTFVDAHWKRIEAGDRPEISGGEWVISLVPTQLQRLLASAEAVAWLRGFRVIFVGGGPVWPVLAEAAARAELPVSLSYGMTETAAMVAALRPEEFLAGARSVGAAMPHATVRVDVEGVVRIAGESVFRGYWPEWRAAWELVTEDLGSLDARGHLHIAGRRDAVIITGGKKVQPAEVEAALRATGAFSDVAVIGVPDAEWGEAVVACYPASDGAVDGARVSGSLAGALRPKRFCAVAEWPRNVQGKIDRAALRRAVVSAGMRPLV